MADERGTVGEKVDAQGWAGPFDLLTPKACATLLKRLAAAPLPVAWDKGYAVSSRDIYEVAANPDLLRSVTDVLGPDVVLWGAKVVARTAGQEHRWHVDAESLVAQGPTLDVWIGLENITSETTLDLMVGSHAFDRVPQEVASSMGVEGLSREEVLAAARDLAPDATIVRPTVGLGQALLFDGRVWHHSCNESSSTRQALLLQYARADVAIVRPLDAHAWPPLPGELRPPCLVVAGEAPAGTNVLVDPPGDRGSLARAWNHQLRVPLDAPVWGNRHHQPIVDGPTTAAERFESHASTLLDGQRPHPPHTHPDEELLLVLGGDPALILEVDGVEQRHPTRRGTLAYYPLGAKHTIEAVNGDATYVMFKWRAGPAGQRGRKLGTAIIDLEDQWFALEAREDGPSRAPVSAFFEGPTNYLSRLQGHVTSRTAGNPLAGHADPYDAVVVVMDGRVRTNDGEAGPNAVLFWPAGAEHNLEVLGDKPARYVVFEMVPGQQRQVPVWFGRAWGRRLLSIETKKALKRWLPIRDLH